MAWLDLLAARSRALNTVLCLGLDPDPAQLPAGFAPTARGIERFAALVLEAALPHVAAVKPNLAFYEAFGSAGIRALERLRSRIPTDVPVLIDAKRGDIGSTAARQVAAIVGTLGAHAVTLSPYVGRDAVAPFLDGSTVFAYLICRTSNPAAGEVQGIAVAADPGRNWPPEPLFARAARVMSGWAGADRLGFVVGATAPAELGALRALVSDRAFLVPGIGAQGGDLEATLREGPARAGATAARTGGGLVVSVSRGIAGAGASAGDARASDRGTRRAAGPARELGDQIRAAAAEWSARMPVLSFGEA